MGTTEPRRNWERQTEKQSIKRQLPPWLINYGGVEVSPGDLALAAFELTIDSAAPCVYRENIGGWVQPWPMPVDKIQLHFTLSNQSGASSSGDVVGYFDDRQIGAKSIDGLASGAKVEGTFWFYGAASGQHTLVLSYMIPDPNRGEITVYPPGIGKIPVDGLPYTVELKKVVARIEQAFIALEKQITLTTNYQNPNGSFGVCKGKKFFDGAPNEWQEITDQTVGISGIAVNPHISTMDVPFTHPFGLLDFEFFVVPDGNSNFTKLLAPNNSETPSTDAEYREALKHAFNLLYNPFNPPYVPGVLGVETDYRLIPDIEQSNTPLSSSEIERRHEMRFRPADGDRVAVFGTWIEDCGHADFHAEVHPPLLVVSAHTPSQQADGTQIYDETRSALIARPYLVKQLFGGENLHDHLLHEVLKQFFWPFHSIEAHCEIADKPFNDRQDLRYQVAPASPRLSSGDTLVVNYFFTVRTGVEVIVDISDHDHAIVRVTMDANKYTSPPLHGKEIFISKDYLESMKKEAGEAYDLVQRLEDVFNPIAALFTSQGILMNLYELPPPKIPDKIDGTTIITDNDQPFPIYGWLTVRWRRERHIKYHPSPFVTYHQVLESAGIKLTNTSPESNLSASSEVSTDSTLSNHHTEITKRN